MSDIRAFPGLDEIAKRQGMELKPLPASLTFELESIGWEEDSPRHKLVMRTSEGEEEAEEFTDDHFGWLDPMVWGLMRVLLDRLARRTLA